MVGCGPIRVQNRHFCPHYPDLPISVLLPCTTERFTLHMRLCWQIIAETSQALANLPPHLPLPAFARKFRSIISNEQTLIPPYPYPYPYPIPIPIPIHIPLKGISPTNKQKIRANASVERKTASKPV